MEGIIVKDFIEPIDLVFYSTDFFKSKGVSIAYFDSERNQPQDILVECMPLQGDFSFYLWIYTYYNFPVEEYSVFICKQFKTDVLISDNDANPYTWILVTGSGVRGKVYRIPTEDDNVFLIRK